MTQPSRFRLIQRPSQTALTLAMGLVSCIAFSAFAQVHDLGTVGAAPELIGTAPVNPPIVAAAPAAASTKSAPTVCFQAAMARLKFVELTLGGSMSAPTR